MAKAILEDQQRLLLQQERQIFSDLQACLADFEEASSYAATLLQVAASLDDLFLLVVVGEFNAGKSACINALLHNDVLEEGVIPTTQQVTVLRYGEQTQSQQREQNILEIKYPTSFLRDISIVDTPGVNAVLLEHQRLTEEFVPRSDLILFITSVDRPFTQSERTFLERIRAWGKKVIIILNKIDLLRKPEELNQVMTFVQDNCKRLLGFQPDIFPVSALQSQQARSAVGHQAVEQWERSRFGGLEDYLFRILDEAERVRLKLLSPLGVMQRVLTETQSALEQRASLLAEDARTISTIDQQQRLYFQDMERNFRPRLNSIDKVIIEMRVRGNVFLDETIRLAHLLDLLQGERIRSTFESEVLADSVTRIEGLVQEMIDWLVEQEHRQWQNVMEYIDRRRQANTRRDDQMIGSLGRQFDYNRRTLLQSVARAVYGIIQTYNPQAETAKLAQNLRATMAQMAIASVSGVGLGVLTLVLVHTLVVDVTGLFTGAVLVGLGVGILPLRRKRAQRQFEAEMEKLRARLNSTITEQFRKELNNSINRIQDAIAPYTRFVRAEQQKATALQERLTQLNGTMQ
ncbi:MAG TPA: dynamin family protein, partial [Ktedonobacteraceae bacterium]|nr:dynamin family protein [Ktedonobacteraceae bacterium]